eukprot:scaffold110_cov315-Pavlova_lutheri.AAC.43
MDDNKPERYGSDASRGVVRSEGTGFDMCDGRVLVQAGPGVGRVPLTHTSNPCKNEAFLTTRTAWKGMEDEQQTNLFGYAGQAAFWGPDDSLEAP